MTVVFKGSSRVAVVRLVQVVVVALLVAVAWLDWRSLGVTAGGLTAEAPPESPPPVVSSAPDVSALPLFGRPALDPSASNTATPAMTEGAGLPESSASYKLFGVLLAPGTGERFALLGEGNGTQEAYREGDAAPDGARLVAVHEGYVVLDRNGQAERLALAEATGTGEPGDGALPAAEGASPDFAAPLAPAANAAAASLQARIRARRAAAQAAETGPKND